MHFPLHYYYATLHKQHWYLDLLFTQTPEVYNTPEYAQYHALQVGTLRMKSTAAHSSTLARTCCSASRLIDYVRASTVQVSNTAWLCELLKYASVLVVSKHRLCVLCSVIQRLWCIFMAGVTVHALLPGYLQLLTMWCALFEQCVVVLICTVRYHCMQSLHHRLSRGVRPLTTLTFYAF
jgi:hypothetical protein